MFEAHKNKSAPTIIKTRPLSNAGSKLTALALKQKNAEKVKPKPKAKPEADAPAKKESPKVDIHKIFNRSGNFVLLSSLSQDRSIDPKLAHILYNPSTPSSPSPRSSTKPLAPKHVQTPKDSKVSKDSKDSKAPKAPKVSMVPQPAKPLKKMAKDAKVSKGSKWCVCNKRSIFAVAWRRAARRRPRSSLASARPFQSQSPLPLLPLLLLLLPPPPRLPLLLLSASI